MHEDGGEKKIPVAPYGHRIMPEKQRDRRLFFAGQLRVTGHQVTVVRDMFRQQ